MSLESHHTWFLFESSLRLYATWHLPTQVLNVPVRGSLWRCGSWGHSLLCVWQSHFTNGLDLECPGLILFTPTGRVGKKKSLYSINNWTAGHIMQPQVPGLTLWLPSGSAGSAKGKFSASPTTCPVLPPWTLHLRGLLKFSIFFTLFISRLYHSLNKWVPVYFMNRVYLQKLPWHFCMWKVLFPSSQH